MGLFQFAFADFQPKLPASCIPVDAVDPKSITGAHLELSTQTISRSLAAARGCKILSNGAPGASSGSDGTTAPGEWRQVRAHSAGGPSPSHKLSFMARRRHLTKTGAEQCFGFTESKRLLIPRTHTCGNCIALSFASPAINHASMRC